MVTKVDQPHRTWQEVYGRNSNSSRRQQVEYRQKCKAGYLGRVDDSGEVVHIVHAQIGDGEGAASHLMWTQLAILGLCMQN